MPQVTEQMTSHARRLIQEADNENVAVTTGGPDDIYELVVSECARFACEIKNEGANALDAFQVLAKFHKDGNYVLLFSAAADFTSPAGLVVDASGDLTTLAAGATGWLVLDVLGLYAIKLRASANVAGATQLDLYGRAA